MQYLEPLIKTPLPFQEYSIDWLRKRKNMASLLCHEQGLGKTFITCAAITPPAIIVCPAFLQFNWQDELENEYGYKTRIVKCENDLYCPDAEIFITSYYFLVKLNWSVIDAQTFVMDEFHYAKNVSAKRTQAATVEIECTPTVILLSGTPVPSRPIELFPVLEAIGAYTRGYYSFAYRFCAAKQTDWGLDVRGASDIPTLVKILRPWMLRFTKKQVLKELPEKSYRVLSQDLQLPPEEKAFHVEEFRHVDPEVAFETLSTVMRIHAGLKFPIVCEIIDHHLATTKDKLIIFAHHREEMLLPLQDRYGPIAGAVSIVGGMTTKAKNISEKTFQNVESCRIIILGIQAGGVGLTLTAASRVLMAESSWVPGVIDQAADRAHRIGQHCPVSVDIVTIRGSIDEYQIRRALEKQTVIDQLIKPDTGTTFMNAAIAKKIKSIRAALDAIETEMAADDEGEDEEEPAPTTRRARRGATNTKDEDAKPARRRGRPAKAKVEEDDDDEEEPAPRRRGRPAKAKAAEDEEDDAPAPRRRGRPAKAGSPIDDVRAKASELMKATSRATLTEILRDFEADKVTELDPADYDDFMAACEEELAAA